MADAIRASKKSRGRPATGKGQQVVVRMQPDLLIAVDRFAADQNSPSRPEAVRTLLQDHLTGLGYLKPSDDMKG